MNVRDTLLIGDQVTLSFKTTVPKGAKFTFPTPENPITQGVELVGVPYFDTLSNRDGVMEIQTNLTVTSFDSGSYVLPPLEAYLHNLDGSIDTVTFNGGNLVVNTIQIDTTSFKPYDIKGQMTQPYTVKEFLPWAGGLVLLAVLVYLLVRMIKNIRAKRSLFGREVVADPPHIVALRSLEKIRGEKLWQNGQEKLYYTEITDTLREYLEARFGIQAMERTSGEILEALANEKIEPKEFKELKELLGLSDLVKFAKYTANVQENENAIPVAVRFINSTYQQELEEEKEKEG
jgi:hypothetical protein